jgi:hypothetical protein
MDREKRLLHEQNLILRKCYCQLHRQTKSCIEVFGLGPPRLHGESQSLWISNTIGVEIPVDGRLENVSGCSVVAAWRIAVFQAAGGFDLWHSRNSKRAVPYVDEGTAE